VLVIESMVFNTGLDFFIINFRLYVSKLLTFVVKYKRVLIVILTDFKSPRLQYVLDFIFKEVFGQDYIIQTSLDSSEGMVLYYGTEFTESHCTLCVTDCGLLRARGLDIVDNSLIKKEICKYSSWLQDIESAVPDIFSIVFYCLSRYEEYVTERRDVHGRFLAKNSIMQENNWVERPIVDEILKSLATLFYTKYNFNFTKSNDYRFISTLDIDQAWAYNYKGFEGIFGFGRDLMTFEWRRLISRLSTLTGRSKDPFDTYNYIKELHLGNDLVPIFFILAAAKRSKNDRNHSLSHKEFVRLLHVCLTGFEIGIHPSYRSNDSYDLLEDEMLRLEKLTDKSIRFSRQHFLKMELPTTYLQLIKAGIERDFTMGYSDSIGYRAGTGHAFMWYDLLNEETTNLRVQPFQVMDGTLNFYMALTPEVALSRVLRMMETAKELDSPFCILWHNSSFDPNYGWEGWASVYESILKNARKD